MKFHRPNVKREYILNADRESEIKTRFVYRRLKWKELAEVRDAGVMSLEQAMKIKQIMEAAEREGRELAPSEVNEVTHAARLDSPESYNALLKQNEMACRFAEVEVKGAIDDEGKPFDLTTDEFLDLVDEITLIEVGSAIIADSQPSESQRKN